MSSSKTVLGILGEAQCGAARLLTSLVLMTSALLLTIMGCNVATSEDSGPAAEQDASATPDGGATGDTGTIGDAGTAGDTGPHGKSHQMTFRGAENNQAYVAASTSEGGYIIGGHTRDIPDPEYAFWIIKLDPSMGIEWQKAIKVDTQGGYRDQNGPYAILQVLDGGYLMTASVLLPQSALVNHWMFKFTSTGELEWQKIYGIGYMDGPVAMTSDGRLLLTGVTYGEGTAVASVLRVAPDGAIEWQKGYSGYNLGTRQVVPAPDGGFAVLAGAEGAIGLVFTCDAEGTIQWQNGIGPNTPQGLSQLTSLYPAPGGGYLLTGDLYDASDSAWLMKLAPDGTVEWERTYAGAGGGIGFGLWALADGSIVIDGYAGGYPGRHDGKWMLKLDGDGGIIWQRSYSGQNMSFTRSAPVPGGGLALVGQIAPGDGGGRMDSWVVVTNPDGSVDGTCPLELGGPTDGTSSSASTTVMSADLQVIESNVIVLETNATVTDGDLQAVDLCGP